MATISHPTRFQETYLLVWESCGSVELGMSHIIPHDCHPAGGANGAPGTSTAHVKMQAHPKPLKPLCIWNVITPCQHVCR